MAYRDQQEIARRAQAVLLPYLEKNYPEYVYYPTDRHKFIQKYDGDVLFSNDKVARYLEFKSEAEKKSQNLFIETWSNKPLNPGWYYKCQAYALFYYFLDVDELYVFRMEELRRWADSGKFQQYPEVRQKKNPQKNDSWGRCVPIEHLRKGVRDFKGPIHPKRDERF